MTEIVAAELAARADPDRAPGMAAYMKTEMPFYGVTKPGRKEVLKRLIAEFPPTDRVDYRNRVTALWNLPHREEKYLAIDYARSFPEHVTFEQLDLYERLITQGAWWDFVDDIARHLVGSMLLDDRDALRPVLYRWIDSPDMWLRRSAIICQLHHGDTTDVVMLLEFCRRRAHEKEFFIRKAIGWALRQHARTDPDTVRRFLAEMGDDLSGLSRREAAKHL